MRENRRCNGRFLREKLISEHGHFSSHEGHKEPANGQDSWGFFKDAQGFGRMDAGSCVGFSSSRPPTMDLGISIFLVFVPRVALRNLDLLIKTGWSVICPL